MIIKVNGGYRIKHCKSKGRGFISATPKPISKKKAMTIHGAIFSNRMRKLRGK